MVAVLVARFAEVKVSGVRGLICFSDGEGLSGPGVANVIPARDRFLRDRGEGVASGSAYLEANIAEACSSRIFQPTNTVAV